MFNHFLSSSSIVFLSEKDFIQNTEFSNSYFIKDVRDYIHNKNLSFWVYLRKYYTQFRPNNYKVTLRKKKPDFSVNLTEKDYINLIKKDLELKYILNQMYEKRTKKIVQNEFLQFLLFFSIHFQLFYQKKNIIMS